MTRSSALTADERLPLSGVLPRERTKLDTGPVSMTVRGKGDPARRRAAIAPSSPTALPYVSAEAMWHQMQGTSRRPRGRLTTAPRASRWGEKVARFIWLWRNASYAQSHAMDAVHDELDADELSRAQDGSMGFPPPLI
jgi:hypothetical protein